MKDPVSLSEAARRLGVSRQFMSEWRSSRGFPPTEKRGRALVVDWPKVEAWYRRRQRAAASREHERAFRRARSRLWTELRWLFAPQDLAIILDACETVADLRRLAKRLGVHAD